MNTRKFPRSMTEAFGPHTSRDLHPMATPRKDSDYSPVWWMVMWVLAVVAVLAVVVTA